MTDTTDPGTRRDFLYYATAGAGTVVAGAAAWPLINQMSPAADVQALSQIRVDISGITEGAQLTVTWRGKPVFIRNRTAAEIEAAQLEDPATLPDPSARNSNLEDGALATDDNRTIGERGDLLVMIGVCTHLGCVPLGEAGDFDGWFCPCHGSHYDTSGRIRKGPAPENLAIPRTSLGDDMILVIG